MDLRRIVRSIENDFLAPGAPRVVVGGVGLGAVDPDGDPEAPAFLGFGVVADRSGRERLDVRVTSQTEAAGVHQALRRRYGLTNDRIRVVQSVEASTFDRLGLAAGDAVGHADCDCYGTIGGFVVSADGVPAIISNSHVLARSGYARLGDLLVDGRGNPIGTLVRATILRTDGINEVDAAIGEMFAGTYVRKANVLGVARSPIGTLVTKRGATTGVTVGRVVSEDFTVRVATEIGRIWFRHQLAVDASPTVFSKGGDSGSLVHHLTSPDLACGLLFAGDAPNSQPSWTYVNQLARVVHALRLA